MNDNDAGDPNEIEMMAVTTRMQVLGEMMLTPPVCAELAALAQQVLGICQRQDVAADLVE